MTEAEMSSTRRSATATTHLSRASIALRWIAPLALMALIFYLSAQPNLSSGLGIIDLIGRKLVHAGIYALLCLLWWRALATTSLKPPAAITIALGLSIGYGVSDELHQTLVDGRHGAPIDVGIDAVGAVLAAALIGRRGQDRADAGHAR